MLSTNKTTSFHSKNKIAESHNCRSSQAQRLKKQKTLLKLAGFFVDAEEEGFEPPVPCGTTVFKTAAFDHSATPLCFAEFRAANVKEN